MLFCVLAQAKNRGYSGKGQNKKKTTTSTTTTTTSTTTTTDPDCGYWLNLYAGQETEESDLILRQKGCLDEESSKNVQNSGTDYTDYEYENPNEMRQNGSQPKYSGKEIEDESTRSEPSWFDWFRPAYVVYAIGIGMLIKAKSIFRYVLASFLTLLGMIAGTN